MLLMSFFFDTVGLELLRPIDEIHEEIESGSGFNSQLRGVMRG